MLPRVEQFLYSHYRSLHQNSTHQMKLASTIQNSKQKKLNLTKKNLKCMVELIRCYKWKLAHCTYCYITYHSSLLEVAGTLHVLLLTYNSGLLEVAGTLHVLLLTYHSDLLEVAGTLHVLLLTNHSGLLEVAGTLHVLLLTNHSGC